MAASVLSRLGYKIPYFDVYISFSNVSPYLEPSIFELKGIIIREIQRYV